MAATRTALEAFCETLDHVRGTNDLVVFLKSRGFSFERRRAVISWTRSRAPDADENDVMVELFLYHGYGGFSRTTR